MQISFELVWNKLSDEAAWICVLKQAQRLLLLKHVYPDLLPAGLLPRSRFRFQNGMGEGLFKFTAIDKSAECPEKKSWSMT